MARQWPGNVRELQNFVRRVVMFCPAGVIRPDDLMAMERPSRTSAAAWAGVEPGPEAGPASEPGQERESEIGGSEGIESYKDAKERVVKRFTLQYVSDLLEKTGGNVTKAAELSGLRRTALQKIMRRIDMKTDP